MRRGGAAAQRRRKLSRHKAACPTGGAGSLLPAISLRNPPGVPLTCVSPACSWQGAPHVWLPIGER